MHIICLMGGEHPGVPWCERGGGGLSVRCSVICSAEMSKLISSEDIRENGTPRQLVSPLTGTSVAH